MRGSTGVTNHRRRSPQYSSLNNRMISAGCSPSCRVWTIVGPVHSPCMYNKGVLTMKLYAPPRLQWILTPLSRSKIHVENVLGYVLGSWIVVMRTRSLQCLTYQRGVSDLPRSARCLNGLVRYSSLTLPVHHIESKFACQSQMLRTSCRYSVFEDTMSKHDH